MQTFSNASSSEMLTRVRLTDGSTECFRPFDESQALQIWRGVDPIHLTHLQLWHRSSRLLYAPPNAVVSGERVRLQNLFWSMPIRWTGKGRSPSHRRRARIFCC